MKKKDKQLRQLPKVPLLIDELSLAPEVVLMSIPDCLLETQMRPGTYQVSKHKGVSTVTLGIKGQKEGEFILKVQSLGGKPAEKGK